MISRDEERFQAALAGSREAFAEIVSRHEQTVRAYLAQYVRSGARVDDLAQEVFLAAYRTIATYRGEGSLVAWLLGIARHRVLSYLRDEARRRAREESLERDLAVWRAEEVEAASDDESNAQRIRALRACLEELPPQSRTLVGEYYQAEQGRERPVAVRMRMMRIRRILGQCVRRRMQESEESQ